VHRDVAVRGSVRFLPSSARLRCSLLLWLAASAAGTSGCTLTEDSFEPARVDGAETQSEPTLPGVSTTTGGGSAIGEQSGLPTTGTNSEGVPNVRPPSTQMSMLEPSGAGGDTGAADAGVAPASVGRGDAGASADAGAPVTEPPVTTPPVTTPPVVVPPVVTPPSTTCTSLSFGGSCYEVFNSFLAWDAAEQQCVAWGGHLASIGTPEENVFLDGWPAQLGITTADGSGIWVGGTDVQQDGVFLWVDGTAFSFLGWAPGQPDDGAGTDCIEKRNDGTGQWYDRRCTDALRYVCERPL
jgi:hypothetical protein